MTVRELEPQCVWNNFDRLTAIPRASRHEEQVSAFLEGFGRNLGLQTERDSVGNVLIHKPASPGMEGRPKVILQAHMDMVPQKDKDKVHDFLTDPIKTHIEVIDGEQWVMADRTTLGADDGLGCAAIMAVLESDTLRHGPVDGFFTIGEETGMTGVRNVKPGFLSGDYLINFDSETEGELYVGCAGGYDFNAQFNFERVQVPQDHVSLELTFEGMLGGHSGMDIEKGRLNANKIASRCILPLVRDKGCMLVSFVGGDMRNAIPREAVVVITVPRDKMDEVAGFVGEFSAEVKNEAGAVDPDFVISIRQTESGPAIERESALNLLRAVVSCPDGVFRMSLDIEGVVDSSNNIAIVRTDCQSAKVTCMLRGLTDSLKIAEAQAVRSIFEMAGAEFVFSGWYSGWKPNMNSPVLKKMKETYVSLFGSEPAVKALHGGLECGILSGVYPDIQMISCGPTLCSPHSPDERALVTSVSKWWKLIVSTLESI